MESHKLETEAVVDNQLVPCNDNGNLSGQTDNGSERPNNDISAAKSITGSKTEEVEMDTMATTSPSSMPCSESATSDTDFNDTKRILHKSDSDLAAKGIGTLWVGGSLLFYTFYTLLGVKLV